MEVSAEVLREIIREVLKETCGNKSAAEAPIEKHVDPSGVLCIKAADVKCTPYDVGVTAKVALSDLVTLQESPRMGCGILEIDHSAYPWTLTYDEFYYVVNGILEVIVEGRHVTGRAGDVLHIPKGTSIHFSSPETCRAVYFTYPADWENAT